jgi:hypothetical protein
MDEGIIVSTIKNTPIGRWYIEIKDVTDKNAEVRECLDVFEYADIIEEMGKKYGGMIEVRWKKDDDVTPEQVNEVRMQMNAYEAQQEAIANGEMEAPDQTPDFLKEAMD